MPQPLRLGEGPSQLGEDPNSQIQRGAGYEVSDFHGAFTHGAVFQPTRIFRALGPIEVVWAGSIDVTSGKLAIFDPLDAHADETAFTFQRAVPSGTHDVFLSRAGGTVASLVRFADREVARWTPALFAGSEVCPRPPLLPMFSTRYSVSFADAEIARGRELPPAAAEVLAALRHGRSAAPAAGFVALDVGGAGQYASWFGEDESGEVVALATEYGLLRQLTLDSVRVPVQIALAGEVALEGFELAVAAAQRSDGFAVSLRPGDCHLLERVLLEGEGNGARQPRRTERTGARESLLFDDRPAASDMIRLDFAGISRPRLHLDPASIERKLERWHAQELLAVDRASIAQLAQRFCEEPPDDLRDWLVDQDEVEDLFI